MAAGDALARGARKAQFPPAGGEVTQEKWDAIFEGFDAERYRGDAGTEEAGNGSPSVGENTSSAA